MVELVAKGRRGADALEDLVIRADERGGGTSSRSSRRRSSAGGPIQINWGGDVEVRIICPTGADLDLAGGSTDLKVDGELGEVTAKSASGDLSLNDVTKSFQLKTASGDISVGTIHAEGTIVTVSGDLEIRRILAPLNARSVSGGAKIGAIEAGELSTPDGVRGRAHRRGPRHARLDRRRLGVRGSRVRARARRPGAWRRFRTSRRPQEPSSRSTSRPSAATSKSCARPKRSAT